MIRHLLPAAEIVRKMTAQADAALEEATQ